VLGLGEVDEDKLYTALDWLLERQPAIETALAKRHLTNGTLVLYDVSSSYMEGRCCPLAKRGYSRDGRKGTLQIIYGLLCAPDGCPVAIEVFDGNTADPMTLATQVEKLKQRFHLDHVVLVGDRGMITQARITDDIKAAGLDWITALRAPAIKALLETGALQLSLFDQRDMASITAPDFPGERLVVCRNPDLAAERTRKRQDLLAATERDLARIQAAVARRRAPLRDTAEIALAVGAVLDKHKMAKHFDLESADAVFSFARKAAAITAEAAADGIYVVRTSLPAETLDDAATVPSYKSLPGGAGVSLHKDGRPPGAACASLAGRSGARACLPLHAGLLPGTAHAPAPGADAVRRHRQGRRRSAAHKRGSAGAALTGRCHQADDRSDRGRVAGAQLPFAVGRSRDGGAQHHHHRDHTRLSADRGDQADADPAEGLRSPRGRM
jgi:hypothetical protein